MNALNITPIIRLLLIDSDSACRQSCRQVLEQHSIYRFEVIEAETGRQGLKLIRSEVPDCIVIDQQLPDLDASELLADLAEQTGELPAPVVVMTSEDGAAVAVNTLKNGASDYLAKTNGYDFIQRLPGLIVRTVHENRILREKEKALERLRETEAKYRTLVEQIPAITYIASVEAPGKLLYVSPQTQQLGYRPETWLDDPLGIGLIKWVHPDDRETVIEQFAKTYEHHMPLRCEYRVITHDGKARWVLDEANVVRDDAGRPLFLQGILVDITADKEAEQELEYYRRRLDELVAQRTEQLEKQTDLLKAANANMDKELCDRKQAEAALRASEARFCSLLESVGEGILGLDTENRCTFVNKAALHMIGYGREELLGGDVHAKLRSGRADGSHYPRDESPIYQTLREGISCHSIATFSRKNGTSFPAGYSSYPIRSDDGINGAVIVFRDVSEVPALTQKLSYEASHDRLTGLANRIEFERRLGNLLAATRESRSEHTLCYLDLDQFKIVNDSYGRAAGDQLLQSLGHTLENRLRQSDILARLGGGEFGLLLEHCPLETAWIIANNLRDAVRKCRLPWARKDFLVSVSIGITTFTAASGDPASVLRDADAACCIAKKKGADRIHIFDGQTADYLSKPLTAKHLVEGKKPGWPAVVDSNAVPLRKKA
ncbi:diguanylate cyclase domain-containing protein [Methylocaldum sp.]|uniref:diguanylate cyclase domain-containing protein n=1 Tax=Methylocaldum sp. TaxID=1969727 RepID=UPI002D595F81|nr:diguanylate cyclase [Methylocaldum sp.]HYE34422.1 diguanylate cyclase [Methylocaldum sp.]